MVTFIIEDTPQGKSIRCLVCGKRSYNLNDIAYRYCGNCHQYHDDFPGPVRIVRSRQQKQVSPNHLPVVYCGRPSKWGNPFSVDTNSPINNYKSPTSKAHCVKLFEEYFRSMLDNPKAWIHKYIHELDNTNLSCWCKLSEPCHVDIILTLLNERSMTLKRSNPKIL